MTAATGAGLLPFYSFDTSAIINGRRDIFRPSTFGALWARIADMVSLGQVAAVDEVKHELMRRDDDAAKWARSCKGLFVPLTRDVQLATRQVLAAHPKLLGIGGGMRNGADAFVIALAVARGGTVVTQEMERGLAKPKIPDVCIALGVPWMTLPQFVDAQGWHMGFSGPRRRFKLGRWGPAAHLGR